ncbi:aspartyl-phosphate phosphatase Spo0E family protein [Paenibacillus rubinfantis]|uniref:aspartyl-phosphate phosphatase Spo0E family protein n=1 Tax=Paenibacillus rubinfantis TaxID=1720296 RepID=UPI00073E5E8B|nr:aspartyl-phosphate phosphatase Spo0E family protein [Paenibacillus rubinfantis]
MSKSIKDIEEAIRRKREVLNRAGERFGVRSPYVLKKSQELDSLLNEYSVLSMSSQKRVK